jgi:putative ABC transport system substrate-binding protein
LLPFVKADAEVQTWIATFVQTLRELGWIDGSNIQIDTHWTGADVGRINQLAIEVIGRRPHVIFANGPLAVASLKQITSTIPIVFAGVADPVGSGLVAGPRGRPKAVSVSPLLPRDWLVNEVPCQAC